MDSRRWWLLAAAVPVALGCALATARPALTPGRAARRRRRRAPRGRDALAQRRPDRPGRAPGGCSPSRRCCPVSGILLALARRTPDPLAVGGAALGADRARLRRGDRRRSWAWSTGAGCAPGPGSRSRSALFLGGLPRRGRPARRRPGRPLVGVRPDRAAGPRLGRRRHLRHHGRRADPAGRHRGRAAGRWRVVLLVGTVFLTLGRGLATSALLSGTPPCPRAWPASSSQPACCSSPLRCCSTPGTRPAAGDEVRRGVDVVGLLLPHFALLTAVADGRRRRR